MAMFLDVVGSAFAQERYAFAARACRDRAARAVADTEMTMGLFTGFVGVALDVHRTHQRFTKPLGARREAVVDPCAEIDDFLLTYLRDTREWVPFDVMSGAAGILIYALERLDAAAARPLLDASIDQLVRGAHHSGRGAAWNVELTEMSPDYLRETFPDGMYALGAAHGLASVIGALGQVVAALPDHVVASALLDEAIRYLLASRLPGRVHYSFPRLANAETRWPDHTDLSWCWGDPGIALCLLTAAGARDDCGLAKVAITSMRELSSIVPDPSTPGDACLCHGWAGVAHIFIRFFEITGDECFADAARRWFRIVFERATHDDCIGGLLFRTTTRQLTARWQEHPGVLNGAAGVGLALLTAMGMAGGFTWDRMFGFAPTPGRLAR